jgi:hypothetical protein
MDRDKFTFTFSSLRMGEKVTYSFTKNGKVAGLVF